MSIARPIAGQAPHRERVARSGAAPGVPASGAAAPPTRETPRHAIRQRRASMGEVPSAPNTAWADLAAATTDGALFAAWLGVLCARISGVKSAALLLESGAASAQAGEFLPVAKWPETIVDLSVLAASAEKTLASGRSVHEPLLNPDNGADVLSYPLLRGERVVGAIAIHLRRCSLEQAQQVVHELHWASAWVHRLLAERGAQTGAGVREQLAEMSEHAAILLRDVPLKQALIDLANRIAQALPCDRVAIGLVRRHQVRLEVLSGAAWFDNKAELTQVYEAAMVQVLDAGAALGYSKPNESTPFLADLPEAPPKFEQVSSAKTLAELTESHEVLCLPLQVGAETVAVMTLERREASPFLQADYALLDASAALVAPAVKHRLLAARGVISVAAQRVQQLAHRLLGRGYLTWKFVALLIAALVFMLITVDRAHRLTANTRVEGSRQHSISAPHQGFIRTAYARAGDRVEQGAALAELDNRELRLDKSRLRAELEQNKGKLREALATSDMAAYELLNAQTRQAQAQLAVIEGKLKRAVITAPFAGQLIKGDLSQKIGAPVEIGEELFQIIPSDDYRVILEVDQRDMPYVVKGQDGQVLMRSASDDPIAFTIAHVVPLASAQDGATVFRVEASLQDAPKSLRPGMEGVSKINAGERSLWWLFTHRIRSWARLTFWEWLP